MIRELAKTDLSSLIAIEQASQVCPWSKEAFMRCFEADYPGWAVEHEGEVIGFVILSFATGECHVLNLCISPEYQHKGWGHALLEYALSWSKMQGAMMAYLEVRRSNHPAIKLYRKMNFKEIGQRKNYYPVAKGREDALVFARDLGMEDMLDRENAFPSLDKK